MKIKRNDPENERILTVGEFRLMLSGFLDDDELQFSGLHFGRLKSRGPQLANVEFVESVYRNSKTGRLIIEEPEEVKEDEDPFL